MDNIINFERKGINISLKIKEFTVDNNLEVYWKTEGKNVIDGTNKYANDGFFRNGTFNKDKNAIILRNGFRVNGGKKINGITLEGEILKYFKEKYEKLYTERKKLFDETVEKIVNGEVKIKWYDTTEWLDGYDYPVKRFKIDISEELDRWKVQKEVLKKFGFDVIESNTTGFIEKSLGDEHKNREMAAKEIFADRLKKKIEKETRLNELFLKAKETGEKQEIKHWAEECNDEDEECNIDMIYLYAMPDGSIKEERSHTY